MDIHAPSGKIESIREYAVHLSMVVLGILIALGFDEVREVHQERELVRHSIQSMRAEVEINRKLSLEVLASYSESRKTVEKLIDVLEKELAARSSPSGRSPESASGIDDEGTYDLTISIPSIRSGAWQAAMATQALAHMEYEQASAWSALYSQQSQAQLMQNEWISVLGKLSLLTLTKFSSDSPTEQLREQLAFARETLQRIIFTETIWQRLLVKYDATLKENAS